jgi:hypothetical protein
MIRRGPSLLPGLRRAVSTSIHKVTHYGQPDAPLRFGKEDLLGQGKVDVMIGLGFSKQDLFLSK